VDVDRSGSISLQELQSALLNGVFVAAFVINTIKLFVLPGDWTS
jgi:hypothetical protein